MTNPNQESETMIDGAVNFHDAETIRIHKQRNQRAAWLYATKKTPSRTRTLITFFKEAAHWLRAGNQPPNNPISPYTIPGKMWATLWILLCIGVLAACYGALA